MFRPPGRVEGLGRDAKGVQCLAKLSLESDFDCLMLIIDDEKKRAARLDRILRLAGNLLGYRFGIDRLVHFGHGVACNPRTYSFRT